MKPPTVRIKKIIIENFKNVKFGQILFENNNKNFKASVLGLYGQNGSGKTALIDSIVLLKHLLCGSSVPKKFYEYINVESEKATLTYYFCITTKIGNFEAIYKINLGKKLVEISNNIDYENDNNILPQYRVVIFDEIIKFSFKSEEKNKRMSKFIDTSNNIFLSKEKYSQLIGKNKKYESELLFSRRLAFIESRSFVFSREILKAFSEKFSKQKEFILLESLVIFGNFYLFCVNTDNSGYITLNALPISFRFEKIDDENLNHVVVPLGRIMLPLDDTKMIPKHLLNEVVYPVINDMNIVLQAIVPNLTIDCHELDSQFDSNGILNCKIQLVSLKNGKEIPLKYESEGIQKIISVLHLLISCYNNEGITVAIDELDSGIFEYLLGEILKIFANTGKGQLIFTSHNLRPLETLDNCFIAFTTTNPENRYIRLNGIKNTTNLRNEFFREITLDENQKLYDATNNHKIMLAFMKAGNHVG